MVDATLEPYSVPMLPSHVDGVENQDKDEADPEGEATPSSSSENEPPGGHRGHLQAGAQDWEAEEL